jgi:hypothetical protein
VRFFAPFLAAAIVAAPALFAQGTQTGVRVLFGVKDTAPGVWDGSVSAQGAAVRQVQGWRADFGDAIDGSSWKMSTHPPRLRAAQPNQPSGPPVANGVMVYVENAGPAAALSFATAKGNFDVKLNEIPYGTTVSRLGGNVLVDRIPDSTRLSATPDEEDFPAVAAGKNGDAWMAYMVFRHNPNHIELRMGVREPITDFSKLKTEPGGDQVMVRHYANGAWGEPVAVSVTGGDLYRPAVAVDGKGRAWVFWSANNKGNFDLMARPIDNGAPGREITVSKASGNDVFAVAASDSKGGVWVAWQGWRNGKAAIFAAAQQGDGFGAPIAVSNSGGNEWNPAIAADSNGKVTVAWDSYRNGNYDVYMRTATAPNSWGAEKAIAATDRYEAYPSIAYDPAGRLWAAYEEGGRGWGKDFGAYASTGVALYQGRVIRIRGFEKDGRAIELAADPGTAMPGIPALKVDAAGTQSAALEQAGSAFDADPERVKNRRPDQALQNGQLPKNTTPRLTIDASGRMWVAFRTAHPIWWNPLGTVWTEYVATFDGTKWAGPVYVNHSDNLLDNRPALVSLSPGQAMLIGSSDGRKRFQQVAGLAANGPKAKANAVDPFNNDLFMSTLTLEPAAKPIAAVAAKALPAATRMDLGEVAAVKAIHDYRAPETGMRIMRGEFHRHSEISPDGGGDGTILDQWRYILDAGGLDWVGCCDHDNGNGREYTWWLTQKLTDVFYSPGKFVPMFSYERSVGYPEGHRNVIFSQRGVRPLPRLPKMTEDSTGPAPDTQMLYKYLRYFNGIVASHTSGTNMGTDWRDNDRDVEPIVEIYQGDRQNYEMPDAPRSNSANDSIGGWRPKGFVNLALEKGYMLGFEASSDHISTHISYCNILVDAAKRESVLDGLKKRHVYGSTDNILAEVRSGSHVYGDSFQTNKMPSLQVNLQGTSKFAKVHIVKDNKYVYTAQPNTTKVSFQWTDTAATPGKASYYYVRGEQDNGELVWVSPMWITYNR